MSGGNWWTSIANSTTYGRYLNSRVSHVYAHGTGWKGYGFALRGVALMNELVLKCYNDLMATIRYQIGSHTGTITWVANECFGELTGKTYSLDKMEAAQIELLADLSSTAKLLLSAIAGAIIQHLLDQDIPATEIFAEGTFTVL